MLWLKKGNKICIVNYTYILLGVLIGIEWLFLDPQSSCGVYDFNKTLESTFKKEPPDGVAVLPPNKFA